MSMSRWWINRLDGAHSTHGFTLPSYGRSAVLLDDGTTPKSTMFSVPIWVPLLLSVGHFNSIWNIWRGKRKAAPPAPREIVQSVRRLEPRRVHQAITIPRPVSSSKLNRNEGLRQHGNRILWFSGWACRR